jgi:hypothetical protein
MIKYAIILTISRADFSEQFTQEGTRATVRETGSEWHIIEMGERRVTLGQHPYSAVGPNNNSQTVH